MVHARSVGSQPDRDRHFAARIVGILAPNSRSVLAHFCLVTDEADLNAVKDQLESVGITTEVGPAVRSGARGNALSIYFRDPDDNLIELRTYAGQR